MDKERLPAIIWTITEPIILVIIRAINRNINVILNERQHQNVDQERCENEMKSSLQRQSGARGPL